MIKSAFAEFQIALRGLTVAQSNMQISSHNIANASTEGYSRQYSKQVATKPFASGKVGMWGTGAQITEVSQYRSVFLDTQYRGKNTVLGQYSIKNAQLTTTEVTFNALGESGLTAQLDTYFDTLEDLSKNPESTTTRNNTITQAQTITEQIKTIGIQLREQQVSVNQEVKTCVDTINSLGERIASINKQIKIFEANGSNANDLRDQRNLLIDELSGLANVKVIEIQKNKEYDENDPTSGPSNIDLKIQINGYNFVNGYSVSKLECVQRDDSNKVNEMDAEGLYNIIFADTGLEFDIYSSSLSGELKGLIDMRDGNNGTPTRVYDAATDKSVLIGNETSNDPDNEIFTSNTYKGIPHYMNKLNNFIRSFALSMNEGKTFDTTSGYGSKAVKTDLDGVSGHINSYDLNGNQGELLFTYQTGSTYQYSGAITDYTKINFDNFYVNPHLIDDPELFACSDSPSAGPGNANAVLEYINLKNNTKVYKEGTYQNYIIAMSGELGITKSQAESFQNNYSEVLILTNNQRISISGVDTNEEVVNLTRNQQLYEASAKLISILSKVYATCIDLGL